MEGYVPHDRLGFSFHRSLILSYLLQISNETRVNSPLLSSPAVIVPSLNQIWGLAWTPVDSRSSFQLRGVYWIKYVVAHPRGYLRLVFSLQVRCE